MRQEGIASVNRRSSSGDGLSWMVLASSGTVDSLSEVAGSDWYGPILPKRPGPGSAESPGPAGPTGPVRASSRAGLARLFDHEVQADLGPVLGDAVAVDAGRRVQDLHAVDPADGLGRLPERLSRCLAPTLVRYALELDGVHDRHGEASPL